MNTNTQNEQKKLVLVDGHALAFYVWYSDYPHEIIPGFLKSLSRAITNHEPSHLMVTFDPAPPTFRHEIYPEYKANRPPVPEGFLEECEELYGVLDSLDVSHCKVEGFEADDVLGTLNKNASEAGFEVVIRTSDLDLLQLLDTNLTVEVFSQYWPTRTFDIAAASRRFDGVEPHQLPDLKALMGDRSDNFPGVKGIGERSAIALLNEYADLEAVYDYLEEIPAMTFRGAKRVARLLEENRDEAFKMRTLATIVRDIPGLTDFGSSLCDGLQTRLDNWRN